MSGESREVGWPHLPHLPIFGNGHPHFPPPAPAPQQHLHLVYSAFHNKLTRNMGRVKWRVALVEGAAKGGRASCGRGCGAGGERTCQVRQEERKRRSGETR